MVEAYKQTPNAIIHHVSPERHYTRVHIVCIAYIFVYMYFYNISVFIYIYYGIAAREVREATTSFNCSCPEMRFDTDIERTDELCWI